MGMRLGNKIAKVAAAAINERAARGVCGARPRRGRPACKRPARPGYNGCGRHDCELWHITMDID